MSFLNVPRITLATYIASGAGVALLIFSFLFPYIFTDRAAWSESDGQAYAAAAADLHRLTHLHGVDHQKQASETPVADGAELAAAKARFEAEKQRLDAAVGGRHWGRRLTKWTGMLCIVAAAVGAFYLRLIDLNR